MHVLQKQPKQQNVISKEGILLQRRYQNSGRDHAKVANHLCKHLEF